MNFRKPMSDLIKLAAVVAVMLSSTLAFAQDKSDYSLLWRIHGNGLEKPSYVFGTMHVQDKRAFEFADSVMLAIDDCDAFALEVHPDSLMAAMFPKLMEGQAENTLRKWMSEEDYQEFSQEFQEKSGLELDKVRNQNPMILKEMMARNRRDRTQMSVIVDQHLYGVARTLGKEIFELEKIQTQLDLLDLLSKEQMEFEVRTLLDDEEEYDFFEIENNMLNDMIEVYQTGDVIKIEEFMFGRINGALDSTLVPRNRVMVNSIKSMIHEKSLFSAMGAAHLVGSQGVLQLLRDEGYKVDVVKSKFTGISEKYKVDPERMKWSSFLDQEVGIECQFPGEPILLETVGQVEVMMYLDMSTESVFVLTSVDMRAMSTSRDQDEMINSFAENYKSFSTDGKVKSKSVSRLGYSGVQLELNISGEKTMKIQIVAKDNVYCVMAYTSGGKKYDSLADRYFESLSFFETEIQTAGEWVVVKDDIGACQFLMPAKPQSFVHKEVDPFDSSFDPVPVHMYMYIDVDNMMNYLVAWNDLPNGYYYENGNEVLEMLADEFSDTSELVSEVDTVYIGGMKAVRMYMNLEGQYYTETNILRRGNRVYKLMRQRLVPDERDLPEDGFVDSFKPLPFELSEFSSTTMQPDSTEIPVFKIHEWVDLEKDSYNWYYSSGLSNVDMQVNTMNPNSGAYFLIQRKEYTPYAYFENADSLLSLELDETKGYGDSILQVDTLYADDVNRRILDIKSQSKYSNGLSRKRLWRDGMHVYTVSVFTGEEEMFSSETTDYLNSFKFQSNANCDSLYIPKQDLLLINIESSDSSVYHQALNAMRDVPFEPVHWKRLAELALKPMQDTSFTPRATRAINAIFETDSIPDEAFFRGVFEQADSLFEVRRALTIQLQHSADSNLDLITDFIIEESKGINNLWSFWATLIDSTEYVNEHLEKYLDLATSGKYEDDVIAMLVKLIKKDSTYKARTTEYHPRFLELAEQFLQERKAEIEEGDASFWPSELINSLALVEQIGDQTFLSDYSSRLLSFETSNYLIGKALAAQVRGGMKLRKKDIAQSIESGSGLSLLIACHDYDRISLLPKEWQETDAVHRELVQDYSRDYNEEQFDSLELVDMVNHNDKVFKLYRGKYVWSEESWLSIVGPTEDGTKIEDLSVLISWEMETADMQKDLEVLFKEWDDEHVLPE